MKTVKIMLQNKIEHGQSGENLIEFVLIVLEQRQTFWSGFGDECRLRYSKMQTAEHLMESKIRCNTENVI